MVRKIVRCLRTTVALEMGQRGACDALERGDDAGHEIAVAQRAVGEHAIDVRNILDGQAADCPTKLNLRSFKLAIKRSRGSRRRSG